MANHDDDDFLTGPVPDPDTEPTAAERARAKTFAELVDKTLAGRTPPAISADDRALLEVATVIRATSGGLELPAPRRRALVEDVLRQAVGATPANSMSNVTPLDRGRRRWLPWSITAASTAVAIAAVLMLWLRPAPRDQVTVETPASWRSRPADALIGPIAREHAADASARIDDIFADRLDGYRQRRLEKRGGKR
jgi:hypothetical protein